MDRIQNLFAARRTSRDRNDCAVDTRWLINRRTFLGRASQGIGVTALATLLDPTILPGMAGEALGVSRGVVSPLHVPQRAKRVIFLYMSGGPSQFETFDEKPKLTQMDGQPMPESFTA